MEVNAAQTPITIGICTRRRPGMLEELLDSLCRLELPANIAVRVCVVENDSETHCRQQVLGKNAHSSIRFDYLQEPVTGISRARNCLIEDALSAGSEALIFIDDDEAVAATWLRELCRFADLHGWKPVIQGAVIATFESGDKPYLFPFFQRKLRRSGEKLSSCSSNNTLIPLALVRESGLRFAEQLTTQGGEDTVFFDAIRRRGGLIVYCREAVVSETIPASRMQLKWLSMRKLRVGLMLGSGCLYRKQRSLLRSLYYLLKAAVYALQTLLWLLFMQREEAVNAWLKCCKSTGVFLGYFRLQVNPYKVIDGH